MHSSAANDLASSTNTPACTDAIMSATLDGVVTNWNESAERLYGWSASESIGQHISVVIPPDRMRELDVVLTAVRCGAPVGPLRTVRLHKNGERLNVFVRLAPVCDHSGSVVGIAASHRPANGAGGDDATVLAPLRTPIGITGVSQDIAARKRAEAERDRLYAQLRNHVERLPLGYLAFDADGRIVDWNASAERIFGYSKDEAVGMEPPYEPIMPASAWPQGSAIISRLRGGDMTAHSVNANRTKDGRTITCEWYNTPLMDANGTFLGFVSLAQDVTAREAADHALRASEERFRQITDSISEVFWLTTVDTHEIQYVSPAYETIWARTREQVIANPTAWLDAIHPDDRERVIAAVKTDQDRGAYDEEYRIVRPDGSVRWIRDRAFPVRDQRGRATYVAGVAEDVTSRRQLEEQLRQAHKMEAIGQLAGGIAHDFNNLLTVIAGNSELLLSGFGTSSPDRELLEEIIKAAGRSAALTKQLLAFSRKQVLAPKLLDLNATVVDTERMLRRIIGEHIALTTQLHRPLPPIKADPSQLEQVLLNLAVNARDAMPEGGQLTIRTTDEGAHVILEVADTGTGMTEAVRQRVFEPFFTTKPAGKGTGLGLAAVHGFVTQSHGRIDVNSEPGRGTSFRIWLPIAGEADVAVESKSDSATLLGGAETILVVEDEEGVRCLTQRVLQRAGYTVLTAASGTEAMNIGDEHKGTIHVLLTDVVMPDASGCVVAERLLAAHPDMKVLFVSGYTDDAVVQNGVWHERMHFLQKPFSPAVLTKKIREVLSNAATR